MTNPLVFLCIPTRSSVTMPPSKRTTVPKKRAQRVKALRGRANKGSTSQKRQVSESKEGEHSSSDECRKRPQKKSKRSKEKDVPVESVDEKGSTDSEPELIESDRPAGRDGVEVCDITS
jgi:hypothetical protein